MKTENGSGVTLIYTYTYQTVDGVELPGQVVVIRESPFEVWRYKLSDCLVKTGTESAITDQHSGRKFGKGFPGYSRKERIFEKDCTAGSVGTPAIRRSCATIRYPRSLGKVRACLYRVCNSQWPSSL